MSEHPVAPEFELPNVGPGPDPCSLGALAAEHDFLVLFFQRDPDCPHGRRQVKQVKTRFESYRARDVLPVAVLPATREPAQRWQDEFQLPFPLLVDPWTDTTDDYGQTVRLGFVGDVTDYLGRMPKVVVVDARGTEPRIVWTHSGRSTFDRPSSRDVLEVVDDRIEEAPTPP